MTTHLVPHRAKRTGRIWSVLLVCLTGWGLALTASQAADKPQAWSVQQWRIIQSLSINRLRSMPADPSNRIADNPEAAKFGRALFFDESLGADEKTSCASCHQPERYFTDGRARAGGQDHEHGRNTPTIVGTGYQQWFYWDGRSDSLWSQALVPFEAPNEMGSDRVSVLKRIAEKPTLSKLYQSVFHRPLSLPESATLLTTGAGALSAEPARSNWYRLTVRARRQINRSYANVGKAIAAYVRTVRPSASRFDRYIAALEHDDSKHAQRLITPTEQLGLSLFIDDQKTQCLRCHNGPRFSNDNFQNIGSGTFTGNNLDFGRMVAVQSLLTGEFNCFSRYSDARRNECSALRFMNRDPHQPLTGAFKTPSLRNVSATAPYFHDGRHTTLRDVIQHYVTPPRNAPNASHELQALDLTETEISGLVSFLGMLAEPTTKSAQLTRTSP